MKKFELVPELTKQVGSLTLYRIRALSSFGNVKAGEIGGWVEKERNLNSYGNCWVSGEATVLGDAHVGGNARVGGYALVSGDAWVSGDAHVGGNARVGGVTWVDGNAWVGGDARVFSNAWVSGDAWVTSRRHLLVIDSIGSEDGTLTAFRQRDNSIAINRGCFSGTLEEFEQAVKDRHGDSIDGQIYLALIPIIKLRLSQVA